MDNSGYFPSYIISMSEIGSATGRLDDVMNSLSDYYERETYLKSKIKSSVFYPTMLFIMMSFVILILVTKIFPIFEGMIEELGGQLSSQSSFMMSFSAGMMTGKFAMVFVIAVLIAAFIIYVLNKTEKGKASLNKLLSNSIFTKSIMNKITAYRFASGMSLLLSSGMNAESSINMLLDVVDEPELKSKIN